MNVWHANHELVLRSLVGAQADIDVQPEQFKHYVINEIPANQARGSCKTT
jgi:hypothetical protein